MGETRTVITKGSADSVRALVNRWARAAGLWFIPLPDGAKVEERVKVSGYRTMRAEVARLTWSSMADGKLRITATSEAEGLLGLFYELVNELSAGEQHKPKTPQPAKDAGYDAWFTWYHQCKADGWRVTLQDVANEMCLAHGTIKTAHAEWQAEHGI